MDLSNDSIMLLFVTVYNVVIVTYWRAHASTVALFILLPSLQCPSVCNAFSFVNSLLLHHNVHNNIIIITPFRSRHLYHFCILMIPTQIGRRDPQKSTKNQRHVTRHSVIRLAQTGAWGPRGRGFLSGFKTKQGFRSLNGSALLGRGRRGLKSHHQLTFYRPTICPPPAIEQRHITFCFISFWYLLSIYLAACFPLSAFIPSYLVCLLTHVIIIVPS